MDQEFNLDKYNDDVLLEKEKVEAELIKNTEVTNPAIEKESNRRKINFLDIPEATEDEKKKEQEIIDRFTKDEPVSIPNEAPVNNSYLTLVLNPNLRELELMIRGLEYVKRFNPLTQKDEVILRKIPNHPLNERGINEIMNHLKVYSSAEIKLGRKRIQDYCNSVQQVGRSTVRLIYKNLKNFGMDTQVKQRSAKIFCLAIIEIMDASFSRSIEGKENDLSRATDFRIEGSLDGLNNPARIFNKNEKEKMRN